MKIAIVNRKTKKMESSYYAESPQQDRFGGPHGDPSLFEHVEIPVDLENAPMNQLEACNSERQVDTVSVMVGEEPAFDSKNRPVKGLLGQSVMVPIYEDQPVMEPIRIMRRKS